MTAHKHAALMALYARDAAETETPWLRWESAHSLQVHRPNGWQTLAEHPVWGNHAEYRRKPKTIRIGEIEVPEPVRERLREGTPVYMPWPPSADNTAYGFTYNIGDTSHVKWFQRGLLHLTREAADIHHKALLSFTEVTA